MSICTVFSPLFLLPIVQQEKKAHHCTLYSLAPLFLFYSCSINMAPRSTEAQIMHKRVPHQNQVTSSDFFSQFTHSILIQKTLFFFLNPAVTISIIRPNNGSIQTLSYANTHTGSRSETTQIICHNNASMGPNLLLRPTPLPDLTCRTPFNLGSDC